MSHVLLIAVAVTSIEGLVELPAGAHDIEFVHRHSIDARVVNVKIAAE